MSTAFTDYSEISTRKNFDPTCGITVENIASLVGEYHFVGDAEYPCQVEKDGKRCDEQHKRGWLGRRKDDHECLIGRDCGRTKFKASSTFVAERKRITQERSVELSLKRLEATKGNPAFAVALSDALARLKAVHNGVDWIHEQLPKSIGVRLQSMAKAGRNGVGVLFRYEEIDDKGNRTVQWVPDQIGSLSGVALWEPSNIRTVFRALYEIRDAHIEAVVLRSAGERKLKRWADTLDGLKRTADQVTELESKLSAFRTPENLWLLCSLVSNELERLAAVKFGIRETTGRVPLPGEAQRRFKELSDEVRSRAGGRPFKIDW